MTATHDFAARAEEHRAALRAHCYRMTASLEEAEDLVQETLLRAWRRQDSFEGRSSLRAWLYRIATNTCIDELRRRPDRVALGGGVEVPWLQPFPDEILEQVAVEDEEPGPPSPTGKPSSWPSWSPCSTCRRASGPSC
jgi:RNA polymerase sigma-70 factor (ECF subfamily)